jgi:hypothetical protein
VPKQTQLLLVALGAAIGLYLFSRTTAGAAAVASVTQYVGDLLTPRGIRNNNPGNVVRNSIAWQGALSQADVEALGLKWDATFVQFDQPGNGVRAIGHILTTYSNRGLTTVDDMIRAWSQTDQDVYVANVATLLGVQPTDVIDVQSELPQLALGIIQQENGQQPYAVSDVAAWVYS